MILKALLIFAAGLIAGGTALADATRVVAVDVGHMRELPGALSARGVREYEFNRTFSTLLVAEINRRRGISAITINPSGDNIELRDRPAKAELAKAELLLSIHHDSVQPKYLADWTYRGVALKYSDHFSGYSLFYSEKQGPWLESFRLAQSVGEEFRRKGLRPTAHHAEPVQGENRDFVDPYRGVYRFDDLIVLKSANIPAILIECGVIVNRAEERKLADMRYRRRMVVAVADAVEAYLKGSATR